MLCCCSYSLVHHFRRILNMIDLAELLKVVQREQSAPSKCVLAASPIALSLYIYGYICSLLQVVVNFVLFA